MEGNVPAFDAGGYRVRRAADLRLHCQQLEDALLAGAGPVQRVADVGQFEEGQVDVGQIGDEDKKIGDIQRAGESEAAAHPHSHDDTHAAGEFDYGRGQEGDFVCRADFVAVVGRRARHMCRLRLLLAKGLDFGDAGEAVLHLGHIRRTSLV